MNVNIELVRRGAATVWFYNSDRGKWNPHATATTSSACHWHRGPAAAIRRIRWCPSRPDTRPDCADAQDTDFAVRGSDPKCFDGHHDGRGCD
jgi:hypothetical protein